MAINKKEAVVVEQKMANRFRIAHYDISKQPSGPQIEIAYNAMSATMEPTEDGKGEREVERLVKNCDPIIVSGEALDALCADADARTQELKKQGVPAGLAYKAGQQAAIEALILATIDAQ
jgi:hypothetical protein